MNRTEKSVLSQSPTDNVYLVVFGDILLVFRSTTLVKACNPSGRSKSITKCSCTEKRVRISIMQIAISIILCIEKKSGSM